MRIDDTNPDAIYNHFWKELIEINGVVDMTKLKAELADFYNLIDNVTKVYNEISCGQISKPLTDPMHIIEHAERYYGGLIDEPEVYDEYLERRDEFKEWLKNN